VPPDAPSRLGSQPRLIEPFVELVESWLRTDLSLKALVIHERLVADLPLTVEPPIGIEPMTYALRERSPGY
jgi:hypothetical protein